MLPLLLTDLLLLIYALIVAKKDAAVTYPFREIVVGNYPGLETVFSLSKKLALLKTMHLVNGLAVILIAAFAASLSFVFKVNFICSFITFFVAAFVYWLVFDPIYAINIRQRWHFLGTTAFFDKLFAGKGKIKAVACMVIIIALHVLYFFLK